MQNGNVRMKDGEEVLLQCRVQHNNQEGTLLLTNGRLVFSPTVSSSSSSFANEEIPLPQVLLCNNDDDSKRSSSLHLTVLSSAEQKIFHFLPKGKKAAHKQRQRFLLLLSQLLNNKEDHSVTEPETGKLALERLNESLLLADRYRVVELLGEGAHSQLLRAYDEMAAEHVAIKVMKAPPFPPGPEFFAQIGKMEAEKLQQLNAADLYGAHHIVRLKATFYFGPHFCLVLELLGPTLKSLCSSSDSSASSLCSSPLNLRLSLLRKVAIEALVGLSVIHRHNIIHADLKPANMLFSSVYISSFSTLSDYYLNDNEDEDDDREATSDEELTIGTKKKKRREDLLLHALAAVSAELKLIDFGNAMTVEDAARAYEESEAQNKELKVQSIPYRAPEVAWGYPFGPAIDMWSLGCILFQLYTGDLLFHPTCDMLDNQALVASFLSEKRMQEDSSANTKTLLTENETMEAVAKTEEFKSYMRASLEEKLILQMTNMLGAEALAVQDFNAVCAPPSNSPSSAQYSYERVGQGETVHILGKADELYWLCMIKGRKSLVPVDMLELVYSASPGEKLPESEKETFRSAQHRFTRKMLRERMKSRTGDEETEDIEECNERLVDFIQRLLCYDPEKRLTVEQALQHPFLAPYLPSHLFLADASSSSSITLQQRKQKQQKADHNKIENELLRLQTEEQILTEQLRNEQERWKLKKAEMEREMDEERREMQQWEQERKDARLAFIQRKVEHKAEMEEEKARQKMHSQTMTKLQEERLKQAKLVEYEKKEEQRLMSELQRQREEIEAAIGRHKELLSKADTERERLRMERMKQVEDITQKMQHEEKEWEDLLQRLKREEADREKNRKIELEKQKEHEEDELRQHELECEDQKRLFKEKLEQLKAANAEEVKELEESKKQLKRIRQQLKNDKEEIRKRIEEEKAVQQRILAEWEQEKHQLQKYLRGLETEKRKETEQLEEAKKRLEEGQKQMREDREMIGKHREVLREEQQRTQQEKQRLQEALSQLQRKHESEIIQIKESKKRLKESRKRMKEEREEMEKQQQIEEAEYEASKAQWQQAKQQKEEAQSRLERKRRLLEQKCKEVEDERQEIEAKEKSLEEDLQHMERRWKSNREERMKRLQEKLEQEERMEKSERERKMAEREEQRRRQAEEEDAKYKAEMDERLASYSKELEAQFELAKQVIKQRFTQRSIELERQHVEDMNKLKADLEAKKQSEIEALIKAEEKEEQEEKEEEEEEENKEAKNNFRWVELGQLIQEALLMGDTAEYIESTETSYSTTVKSEKPMTTRRKGTTRTSLSEADSSSLMSSFSASLIASSSLSPFSLPSSPFSSPLPPLSPRTRLFSPPGTSSSFGCTRSTSEERCCPHALKLYSLLLSRSSPPLSLSLFPLPLSPLSLSLFPLPLPSLSLSPSPSPSPSLASLTLSTFIFSNNTQERVEGEAISFL
ncbi:dual-specificity kinase, variant 2 [Balamuthia mandrillaris]